jgi:hypothetical protein
MWLRRHPSVELDQKVVCRPFQADWRPLIDWQSKGSAVAADAVSGQIWELRAFSQNARLPVLTNFP